MKTNCYECKHHEICNKDKSKIHCNIYDKSYDPLSRLCTSFEKMSLYYSFGQWTSDKFNMIDIINNFNNPHIVGIYRGSLPIATNLSNMLGSKFSIGKFQSYNGNKDEKFEMILKEFDLSNTLIFVDDLIDSGNTFKKVKEYMENEFPLVRWHYVTIFGVRRFCNRYDDKITYIHEKPDGWLDFFWEK